MGTSSFQMFYIDKYRYVLIFLYFRQHEWEMTTVKISDFFDRCEKNAVSLSTENVVRRIDAAFTTTWLQNTKQNKHPTKTQCQAE